MSENNNSDGTINRDELNLQRRILYETILLLFEIPRLSVLLLTIPVGLILGLLIQISESIINIRDKLLDYIAK